MAEVNIHSEEKIKNKEAAQNAKSKSILESFEYIVELAEDSNLSKDFFDKAGKHIRYAARKLHLSPMQTVLLAMFVDRSEDSRIQISELARYAGCRTNKILRLSEDVDILESKHYLRASRSNNSLSYRVFGGALQALRKNEPFIYTTEPVVDTAAFFDRFDRLMKEMDDNELTHYSLLVQTMDMLQEILPK